jgi:hypothetical protein
MLVGPHKDEAVLADSWDPRAVPRAETLCHGWCHDGASTVEDDTSPLRVKSLPGEGGYR